jgi:hypothetical protein
MTDDSGFGGLIDYYDEFVPVYLPLPNGKPRSRRSAQKVAISYNLPIVRVGWRAFIDPELAAQRLRETQLRARVKPQRGRPARQAR